MWGCIHLKDTYLKIDQTNRQGVTVCFENILQSSSLVNVKVNLILVNNGTNSLKVLVGKGWKNMVYLYKSLFSSCYTCNTRLERGLNWILLLTANFLRF